MAGSLTDFVDLCRRLFVIPHAVVGWTCWPVVSSCQLRYRRPPWAGSLASGTESGPAEVGWSCSKQRGEDVRSRQKSVAGCQDFDLFVACRPLCFFALRHENDNAVSHKKSNARFTRLVSISLRRRIPVCRAVGLHFTTETSASPDRLTYLLCRCDAAPNNRRIAPERPMVAHCRSASSLLAIAVGGDHCDHDRSALAGVAIGTGSID